MMTIIIISISIIEAEEDFVQLESVLLHQNSGNTQLGSSLKVSLEIQGQN